VAEQVLAGQGIGAWPTCGRYLTGGSTSVAPAAAPAVAPVAARPASTAPSGGTYTVRPGDTLGTIAAAHGVAGGWYGLWSRNSATVPNPNLIFVGQTLRL
jgi:nucleoid-associated protein YgaU